MKTKFAIYFLAGAMTYLAPLSSLLPPLYHTLAEFKSIVEAPELTKILQSGEAILSITREDNTTFVVLTNKHKLVVDIVYEPTQMIGPAKYHLKFHDPEINP